MGRLLIEGSESFTDRKGNCLLQWHVEKYEIALSGCSGFAREQRQNGVKIAG